MQAIIRKWHTISDEHASFGPIMSTLFLFLGIVVLFTLINPDFLLPFNLRVIMSHTATFFILGVGMTMVITTGGIDLSVGSIVALSGVVTGYALTLWGFPLWACLLVAVGMGTLCGLFNAFFVSVVKVPPIIVTLGSMALFRGLAYVILEYRTLYRFPQEFLWLARGRILGLPISVYLALLICIWGFYFLNWTKTGAHMTAVGANEEAARLAGIDVWRTRFIAYTIMGLLTGMATLIWLARLNAAQASIGVGVEFHAIATVVLGGTSIYGGRGLVIGSVLGALVIGAIENGLTVIGLPYYWQRTILGLVFIGIVAYRTIQTKHLHGAEKK